MINTADILETINMIRQENLDIRTITMGISLFDCVSDDKNRICTNIYDKITEKARDLVSTGKAIEKEFCIPIVNKRISVTPIALIGSSACKCSDDYVELAKTLDEAAHKVGVNVIGGYSALVSKGMTAADKNLINSIPEALSATSLVCSSVNVGSTRCGIDMDAADGIRRIGIWSLYRNAKGQAFAVADKGWQELDCREATPDPVPVRDIWRFFTGEEIPVCAEHGNIIAKRRPDSTLAVLKVNG